MHAYCESPDIVLCGNKNDMEQLRVISEVRARSFAEKYDLAYVETSAATGQNVRRSIDILLDKVMTRFVYYQYWKIFTMYIKMYSVLGFVFRMQTAVDRAKLPGRRGLPRQFDDPNLAHPYIQESNKKCC